MNDSLHDTPLKLPGAAIYPTNISRESTVEQFVREAFHASADFLVITGFTSLEYLILFFGKKNYHTQVRVVLGNEPLPGKNPIKNYKYSKEAFKQEIFDYWVENGVSPIHSASVIRLIEKIEAGTIDFRLLEKLHAKMYVGDTHAMLGSSNFSKNGLSEQLEANFRVSKEEDLANYEAQKALANYFFQQGTDFKQDIITLLKNMLQYVTWKEALARAVAELIEGDWLKEYPEFLKVLNWLDPPLWKTQVEAIGQALYILDNTGSLLIADPTGSGKTRLGAVLQACIINRLWLRGIGYGMQLTNTLLICPPQVQDHWKDEFRKLGSDFNNVLSQGRLSLGTEKSVRETTERIKNAKILFIDEAHNFQNKGSNRSITIHHNTADHLVLYTATPINRRVEDIFRLIELLDIDNLSEEGIQQFEKIQQTVRGGRRLDKENENALRGFLRDFMIRRTKKELNKKIDEDPKAYCNDKGRPCRYPKQLCSSYLLNESEQDISIALQINELAEKLTGVTRLREFKLKKHELKDAELQHKILHQRQRSARALAIYNLQATMRSSRIALIEHLKGTEYAKEILKKMGYPIPEAIKQDNATGNTLQKLVKCSESLPKQNFTISLPGWLTDPDEYDLKCQEEIAIYEQIYGLAQQLSNGREERKAAFLLELQKRHELLLAFDSRVISLYFIQKIAEGLAGKSGPEFLVVTGSNPAAKALAKEYFGFGSQQKRMIGLCSDVMAEGVNLQQASAIVLLDMPSVMRIAEQRIGRIDRMNSPHERVEVYFPDDHNGFALRTDRKFFLTAQTVKNVLGSNLDLPEDQLEKWDLQSETLSAQEVIKLYEEEKEKSESNFQDGIQDAFQAVKELLQGEDRLIDPPTYQAIKDSKATFMSKVNLSKVRSEVNFAFFCVRSSKYYAPYWLYIDDKTAGSRKKPVWKELPKICEKLREHLQGAEDIPPGECVEEEEKIKQRFIGIMKRYEIEHLPNKKRRALNLLNKLINVYLSDVFLEAGRRSILLEFYALFNTRADDEFQIDYYQLAHHWIRIVQPMLVNFKQASKKTRGTYHLGSPNFLEYLKKNKIPAEDFHSLRNSIVTIQPLDKRIAACIIGIGRHGTQHYL